jgi:hypothetical protein
MNARLLPALPSAASVVVPATPSGCSYRKASGKAPVIASGGGTAVPLRKVGEEPCRPSLGA